MPKLERRLGRSRQMLAWIPHPPSRAAGFMSARTTGGSTPSMLPAEKSCRSSTQERPCRHRRPLRRENSSSDRRTASCTASGDNHITLARPKHANVLHPEPVVVGEAAPKTDLAQRSGRHEVGLRAAPWPVSPFGQNGPALAVARAFHHIVRIGRGLSKPQRIAIIDEF